MNSENEKRYWEIIVELDSSSLGRCASQHADALNSKVSALLTHVSVMVAVSTGFFLALKLNPLGLVDFIMAFEIAIYLVVTLLCLRVLWITSYNYWTFDSFSASDVPVDRFLAIVSVRKSIYIASLNLTLITTVVFLFTLIVKIFSL